MAAITVREARRRLRELLDRVGAGEEVVILRRGREAARLVPAGRGRQPLPDLTAFRASIKVSGPPLSREVIRARKEARY